MSSMLSGTVNPAGLALSGNIAPQAHGRLRRLARRYRDAHREETKLRRQLRFCHGGSTDQQHQRAEAAAERWCDARGALIEALRDADLAGVIVDGSLVLAVFDRDNNDEESREHHASYFVSVVELNDLVAL